MINLKEALSFYSETLGLPVSQKPEGLNISLQNGAKLFLYPKPDHLPATYTFLNFIVLDLEKAVKDLKSKGVHFEQYQNPRTDPDGIARNLGGMQIAWFKDPSGNILSLIQEEK